MPPSTEMTWWACGAVSAATSSSWYGLWQSTIESARSVSSALERSASPPTSATSRLARPEPESVASTGSPQPRASARAMLPLPTKPSIRAEG